MSVWFAALPWLLAVAAVFWVLSVFRRDVSIVDSLWSLMFLLAALVYGTTLETAGSRSMLILSLVTLWAVRLSAYITHRNWGAGEDRRYQAIRRNNQPGFAWKSLYMVFGLQAVLAWLISAPLMAAQAGARPLGLLDGIGVALWLTGFLFETIADAQLARFKSDPANRGRLMDRGLWRYSRHPNYFGEACVWWGFYLIAVAAGGWWTIFAPLIMTVLLLKVSGVALLERDLVQRRPEYRAYMRQTNAFIPGRPRQAF